MITRTRRLTIALGSLTAFALAVTGCAGGVLTGDAGSGGGETSAGIDTSACPPDFNSTGITDDTVKIGSSSPRSGAAAISLAIGMDAYVDMQNSAGGFEFGDGKTRKVEVIALDDARETSRTRTNVEQLINQDKVFALVGMSGTASNLAIRPLVAENCIPSVYMDSGNNEMGNPDFPWSLAPILPANAVDAKVAVELVTENNADAKIAVLYQNDDLGKAMKKIFEKTLEGTGGAVVADATFEPTDTAVTGQITTLAASGATDFVMLSGNGTFQLQALESIAQSGWKPEVKYLTLFRGVQLQEISDAARENVNFGIWVKDPNDPEVVAASDEMQLFLEWYNKQSGSSSFDPTIAQFGWMSAHFLAENFKAMKEPTRVALIEAVRKLTWDGPSLYSEGINYSIDWPANPFGVQALVVYTNDPEATEGVLYKEVRLVDMTGTVTYEKTD